MEEVKTYLLNAKKEKETLSQQITNLNKESEEKLIQTS
jgi:hypothetical protein